MKLELERAKDYFTYDPSTGSLLHKERPLAWFANKGAYGQHIKLVGKPAGRLQHGYIHVKVAGVFCFAHRVVWFMHNGWVPEWPTNQIDHINGERSDNRIENLRVLTSQENSRNVGLAVNNRSGFRGVCWNKKSGKWQAQIRVGRKTTYLGIFDILSDAVLARSNEEVRLGFSSPDRRSMNAEKAFRIGGAA